MMKKTANLALCGVFSALALVILLLTLFPFATYALPALAGLCFVPLTVECGKGWALSAYAAVSLLALLLVPDIEAKMLFIAFFGYYPIIKALLERLPNRVWEWLCKTVLFNVAAVLGYAALSLVGFSLDAFRLEGVELPLYGFLLAFLVAGNGIFILYDIGITRMLPSYFSRVRPFLCRIFRY